MRIEETKTLAAGLLLTALVGSAHAGKVAWTAPALAAYPTTQTMYCTAVNVSTSPVDVTFEILDYFGGVVQGPILITLAPEQGNAIGDGTGNGARCRFTASTSAKKIRGAALYDDGSGYTSIVPAF
jgi:hypothetical protein